MSKLLMTAFAAMATGALGLTPASGSADVAEAAACCCGDVCNCEVCGCTEGCDDCKCEGCGCDDCCSGDCCKKE
jgi:hypothetical protein